MDLNQILELLTSDLANEYTHMLFYLHHSATVGGLHREEYVEFLSKQAVSEMKHVQEFSQLILGLGGKPVVRYHDFDCHVHPYDIINHAIKLESQVLENYDQRMRDADNLGGVAGTAVRLFLEEQFNHSREDLDNMKLMVK